MREKEFWLALSMVVGTIVGVGLFGLPYVTVQSSFVVMLLYFALVSVGVMLLNHYFVDIALLSGKPHHLPGYAEAYLGKWAKHISVVSESIGLYGAELAYLIVGGSFVAELFIIESAVGIIAVTLIYFIVGAVLVWRGMRSVFSTEFALLVIFFLLIAFFFLTSVNRGFYSPFTLGTYENVRIPYGVIVFSLWGLSVIPELISFLRGNKRMIGSVLRWGVVISAFLYIFFIWSVLRVSGGATTEDALTGLRFLLPKELFFSLLLFGVITTFTSFIALGLALKRMFVKDYGVPHGRSFLMAMSVPLILYLAGFQNFIVIIGVSGALGLTVSGIMVCAIYVKIRPQLKVSGKGKHGMVERVFTHSIIITLLFVLAVLGAVFSLFA